MPDSNRIAPGVLRGPIEPAQPGQPSPPGEQQPANLAPAMTAANGQGKLANKQAGGRHGPTASSERFPIHKVARAVLRVYRGANVTDACLATGIPRPTWYTWLSSDLTWPNGEHAERSTEALRFAARVRHAFGRAQALCGARAQQSVFQAGYLAQKDAKDWRAHHEWLKHAEATRARWHEHRELKIEHAGSVSYLEQRRLVSQLPESEIIDLAALEVPEIRDLLPPPAED